MASGQASVGADLRVRLLWLALFRTVATTLTLVGLAVDLSSNLKADLAAADYASFAIIALSYLVTLVTGVLLRRERVGIEAAWAQIVVDVLLAASVVLLTSGIGSPFTFLYLVTIVGAAFLLGTRGAIVASVLASATFLGVLAVRPSPLATSNAPRFLLEVAIQLLAQLLIAVLSGYVGEQLTSTGGRLRASERSLQSLTELKDEIVNLMPSGLVTCDAQRRVTFVNPAASQILGLAPETRLSSLDELLPGITSGPSGRRIELQLQSPRGPLTLGMTITQFHEGLLVVFQDLTQLRKVEQELHRIDHLATLGRLSAQLAHEVRNPLAAMRGSAQMLASDGGPQAQLARLIMRESDRLAELVEGYLKLARPPPPRLTTARLDEAVHETLELLRADPGLEAVRIEERLEPVEACFDVAQVRQVLINLLRNAAKVVRASGGRIEVRVGQTEGRPLLEVWDSAGAIAPEDLPRLFEPFFGRDASGSGLGLSTVQSIVQSHGGRVTVASDRSSGTTFSVSLPAA